MSRRISRRKGCPGSRCLEVQQAVNVVVFDFAWLYAMLAMPEKVAATKCRVKFESRRSFSQVDTAYKWKDPQPLRRRTIVIYLHDTTVQPNAHRVSKHIMTGLRIIRYDPESDWGGTCESLRIDHVVAEIGVGSGAIIGVGEGAIRHDQPWTRRRGTALEGHHGVALQGAVDVVEGDIFESGGGCQYQRRPFLMRIINLQKPRCVLSTLLPIIRLPLGDRPRHRHIIQVEVIERDVLTMPIPATAPIRRRAFTQTRPGLQIRTEGRVVSRDVPGYEVLHDFDLAGVLADAS